MYINWNIQSLLEMQIDKETIKGNFSTYSPHNVLQTSHDLKNKSRWESAFFLWIHPNEGGGKFNLQPEGARKGEMWGSHSIQRKLLTILGSCKEGEKFFSIRLSDEVDWHKDEYLN